ncbi:dihydrodipicolinate reductase [Loigolactobacillus bifermentans DSM 20003]|uniref:4-hydroxy-tetrahydrodipicolinate reductase n=1 Tax=Loigolactobacillus bifermentans DSM 20003 TaxID=1423726 RepID=A0A0R1GJL1_9LACO|nr:dihydrodipicolinate reductase [Loigolactobacillus bifermentans DSM 20003]
MIGLTKIIVAGFKGRMGATAVDMVLNHDGFELVGVYDPVATEKNLNEVAGYADQNVPVLTLEQVPDVTPDVWIDFTIPKAAVANTKFALEHHISPVIGTTGFKAEEVAALKQLSKEQGVGGLIAPNFGLTAVLMMQFAKQAAKYFPDVEIIEMHHDNKLDAPSGTAIKTAEMMAEVRAQKEQGNPNEKETLKGARGANYDGMHIHSVRLPGLIAHQQVQFGGVGEGLTIRQDTYDRVSFMTGVALACEKVTAAHELFEGLENFL